jgi:hypothetical protein
MTLLWGGHLACPQSRAGETPTPQEVIIPFHHKSDTFGDKGDKGDKEDKGEDLYQEFCEMVLDIF